MNNWNRMFISEGTDLRNAIRSEDKSHSSETYIAVYESLIKLLNAALNKTTDEEERNKIKNVREHVSIGYSDLENADSLTSVDSGWKAPLARTFSTALSESQHHIHGQGASDNGSEALARRSVR